MAATPAAPAAILHRYVLLHRAPGRLRYRNGTVALELVRDCSADLPTWVFRARRVAPRGGGSPRHTGPAGLRLPATASLAVTPTHANASLADDLSSRLGPGPTRPLPTVSPIALAAAARQRAGQSGSTVVIASSVYGRSHLEQMLRTGVLLQPDSPAARVMDALVTLGYATRLRATGRDLPAQ